MFLLLGVWNVVKVVQSELEETESKPVPEQLKGKIEENTTEIRKCEDDATATETTAKDSDRATTEDTTCTTKESDCPKKDTTKSDVTVEEEHNTSPFKKADKGDRTGGHRKRNYRESNKETQDSDDTKKSRKDERRDRSYKSRIDSKDRVRDNRHSWDRPTWQRAIDIGGGYSPGSASSASHYERRSIEMKGQKNKYRYNVYQTSGNVVEGILSPVNSLIYGY